MTMATVEQSAVIPFTREDGEYKIVLVTAMTDRSWIVPKGHLEPDMSPAESAAKEALEEAGVTGRLYPEMITQYGFDLKGKRILVDLFALEVDAILDDWDEKGERERRHVTLEEALELCPYEDIRKALRDLPEFVEKADEANG